MPQRPSALSRSLSLPVLTFYGLGTIVGAGIYVLIGKVAGLAGSGLVYAFLLAGVVAAFTAFSYCELASRFPRAAGEALYVEKGFGSQNLSRLVGWLVVVTGIVSSATIANGFTGYLGTFFDVDPPIAITALVLALGAVAVWGIKESALLVTIVTVISLVGLFYVLYAGSLTTTPQPLTPALTPPSLEKITGVVLGAFLAFYAFIGFEDMVNVVEEVKEPKRTLPLAILLAIGLSLTLYVTVAMVAAYALPIDVLAASDAPLAVIVEAGGLSPSLISVISLIAVINGALVQLIMASRVIYGMADQGLTFRALGRVESRTQTPAIATVLVTAAILIFALWLPLTTLAKLTSFIVLGVFALVNLGLLLVKRRDREGDVPFSVPVWVPVFGAATCAGLMLFQLLA